MLLFFGQGGYEYELFINICLFAASPSPPNDVCCYPLIFKFSVSSENGGMDWRETSTVDALFFGTSYADTGTQYRRKQVQVLLRRMFGSTVVSAGASLPRPAAPEESTEGQINETISINGEAEGGGTCLESSRTDEQYLSDGSGSSFPFWAKTIWLLDQLAILQGSHGTGDEAMRIEVRRSHLLEDSFNQVGWWPSWWHSF